MGLPRIFTTFSDDLFFFGKKLTEPLCNISTISATIRETWRGVDMAKLAEAEDLPKKNIGITIDTSTAVKSYWQGEKNEIDRI